MTSSLKRQESPEILANLAQPGVARDRQKALFCRPCPEPETPAENVSRSPDPYVARDRYSVVTVKPKAARAQLNPAGGIARVP